ncbi:MAG: MATE family efflux transporter [Faecousia sp.]
MDDSKRNGEIRELTRGPIGKQLLVFALPLFAGSLIQLLYNTVDLMFVGQILGAEASAAVGASSLIVTCILGIFTGLSVGVSVSAAKAVGSGDTGQLRDIIRTAAGLTCLLALVFTALGLILASRCLRWMRTPEDILPTATSYLRLYLLSLISIVSYNIGSGILRALGNSRSPMLYQLFGGIANLLGNTVFIYFLNWGVQGAALATACSQGLAAFLTVRHLCCMKTEYRLRLGRMKLDKVICKEFLTVGIPSAVQSVVITLSNLIVQTHINALGVDSIAAFTAYFKVENFIYLPIMAFGQACSTFTSQNIGAYQVERVKKGVTTSLLLGIAVTLGTSALTLIFSKFAFGLFARDAGVIELGVQIAWVAYPFYFVYVFLEVYASAIRGAGKALPAMGIIVVNMCLVRTCVLKGILHFQPSVVGVAAVYPITWVCTAVCLFLYYRSARWLPVRENTVRR